jgi:hypothetical protein
VKVPLISIKIGHRQTPHTPGDLLNGEYQIDAVEPEEIRAVELSILWYTEGKGDEDLGIHHFQRRTTDDQDETPLTELVKFSVPLPKSPLSYEGVLIKVRWRVRVRVFLKNGRNYLAELPFRLGHVPDGRPHSTEGAKPDEPVAISTTANGSAAGDEQHG